MEHEVGIGRPDPILHTPYSLLRLCMSNVVGQVKASFQHPFVRAVMALQVGSFGARFVSAVTGLLLARLLGPAGFGTYALLYAFVSLLNLLQEVGVGTSTVNLLSRAYAMRDRAQVVDVLRNFTRVQVIILFTTGLGGAIAAPWLAQWWYGNAMLGWLASVAVMTVALQFFGPLLSTALQVTGRAPALASFELSSRIAQSALVLTLVGLGAGIPGVVWGQLTAMALTSVVAVIWYRRLQRQATLLPTVRELFRAPSPRGSLRRFFTFSLQVALDKNLANLNATLPILIFGALIANPEALGLYKVAFAVATLPTMLLAPISRMLASQFPMTERFGERTLLQRFFQVGGLSFALTFAQAAVLGVLGPWVIRLLYGAAYEPAVSLMSVLLPYAVIISAGVGIGPIFRTLNRMGVIIAINLITALTLVGAALALIPAAESFGLAAAMLIGATVPTGLALLYLGWRLRHISVSSPYEGEARWGR